MLESSFIGLGRHKEEVSRADHDHILDHTQLRFLDADMSLLCFFPPQKGALIEELNRVSAENKKLTELLTVMCENYTELRNQLLEYTSKNTGVETNTASRKRKAESSNNNVQSNGNNNIDQVLNLGTSESSSSDEDSSKKPREEHIKAKISRVCVRTEASDTSLVSLAKDLIGFLFHEILCGKS